MKTLLILLSLTFLTSSVEAQYKTKIPRPKRVWEFEDMRPPKPGVKINITPIAAYLLESQNHKAEDVTCEADLGFMQKGAKAKIKIEDIRKPKVSGTIEIGDAPVEAFKDADVHVFEISKELNLKTDGDADIAVASYAENYLRLLHSYTSPDSELPELKEFGLKIKFDLKNVAKVKVYDIAGDALTNQMMGAPLVDLLDSKGELLGRFFQALAPVPCKKKTWKRFLFIGD
jgi:hypothetical protein